MVCLFRPSIRASVSPSVHPMSFFFSYLSLRLSPFCRLGAHFWAFHRRGNIRKKWVQRRFRVHGRLRQWIRKHIFRRTTTRSFRRPETRLFPGCFRWNKRTDARIRSHVSLSPQRRWTIIQVRYKARPSIQLLSFFFQTSYDTYNKEKMRHILFSFVIIGRSLFSFFLFFIQLRVPRSDTETPRTRQRYRRRPLPDVALSDGAFPSSQTPRRITSPEDSSFRSWRKLCRLFIPHLLSFTVARTKPCTTRKPRRNGVGARHHRFPGVGSRMASLWAVRLSHIDADELSSKVTGTFSCTRCHG